MTMNHKNEQGYSLIGVLLIITIVAIVDVSLAGITLQSVKTSTKERDNQAVYYIAEAGMEYVIHQLESKVQIISEDNPNLNERDLIKEIFKDDYANGRYEFQDNKHTITYQDFEPIEGKGIPEARITFAVNENPAETPVENTTPYEITSVGEVGSEKRAVGTTFGIEKLEASEPGEETGDGGTGQSAPSYAIFVEDDLLLHGALTISYGGKIGVENINGDIAITNPNNLTVDKPAKFNENEHLKMPSLPKYEFDSTYNC